ncbi:uncharacterized protein N7529_009171 [Penicillium soppii]|uniref:uncharacterized protein n=1 Tax=Penicillium soppii TaxID=69789 RepID=UPI00254966F2|nr:uncharacterized protein N7529_009171 [Penicillium soppii]KAJ5861861.1 hypothetical protein N7529_009171 [Penicillium soppii]
MDSTLQNSTLQSAYKPQAPVPSFQPLKSNMSTQNTLEAASTTTNQVFQSSCSQASAQLQAFPHAINQPQSAPVAPATNPHLLPLNAATAPAAQTNPHQIEALGGPTATAPFLQDFNLVAEAAKRAQIGIVMRDLESVTL